MTIYLERYAELAKRLVSTTGSEALVSLSPELTLNVDLESDREEFKALTGGIPWVAAFNIGGVAAQFSTVVLAANPGMISVVTHVVASPAAGSIRYGVGTGVGLGAARANGVYSRDTRITRVPNTSLYAGNNAAQQLVVGTRPYLQLPSNALLAVPPIVLVGRTGAQGAVLESDTANTAISVFAAGYERAVDAHEIDSTVS